MSVNRDERGSHYYRSEEKPGSGQKEERSQGQIGKWRRGTREEEIGN